MRIINTHNGCETTLSSAVAIVTDRDAATALHDMMVRLLEELTNGRNGELLSPQQLSRILAYKFEVRED